MSQHASVPADIDPQEVARAQDMWQRFTHGVKIAACVIAVGVILLAWITL